MDNDNAMIKRVRKLLAKAEAAGVTPAEAEALTAKATELIARYGIDRAVISSAKPETDQPASRTIDVPGPWSGVRAYLLSGIASAMRCQCIQLHTVKGGGRLIHVFGYTSDLDRANILYSSLLIQMAHGLAVVEVPAFARSPRAWRRSWLLGYVTAVVTRIRAAEHRAAAEAQQHDNRSRPGTALILADRAAVIRRQCDQAYPDTRTTKITYSGSGYGTGYDEGERADIGSIRLAGSPEKLARPLALVRVLPGR